MLIAGYFLVCLMPAEIPYLPDHTPIMSFCEKSYATEEVCVSAGQLIQEYVESHQPDKDAMPDLVPHCEVRLG